MAFAKPVIVGVAGTRLKPDERALFRDHAPAGFILFARNIESPSQTFDLIQEMRDCVPHRPAPVLVDQEGGRVARLKAPHWRHPPPMRAIGALYEQDAAQGERACWLNARLIAQDLTALGFDVDCLPLLDVPAPDGHDIIGDRAFGNDPGLIERLGRIVCEALLAGGVLPVIKHMPGHGRARADSHLELPRVEAPLKELEAADFRPFRALRDMPWAMTAHIVYDALDPAAPATTSAKAVGFMRGPMGFDGYLVSDDLTMKALKGPMLARAQAALDAGCDGLLHCSGDFAEMKALLEGLGPMAGAAWTRLERAETLRQTRFNPDFDARAAQAELDNLLRPGLGG